MKSLSQMIQDLGKLEDKPLKSNPSPDCQRCNGTGFVATGFGKPNAPCPECNDSRTEAPDSGGGLVAWHALNMIARYNVDEPYCSGWKNAARTMQRIACQALGVVKPSDLPDDIGWQDRLQHVDEEDGSPWLEVPERWNDHFAVEELIFNGIRIPATPELIEPYLIVYVETPTEQIHRVLLPLRYPRWHIADGHAISRAFHTSHAARILVNWYNPPRGWTKIAFNFNGRIENL